MASTDILAGKKPASAMTTAMTSWSIAWISKLPDVSATGTRQAVTVDHAAEKTILFKQSL
ncbi:hypothetical protein Defa_10120 [Desulfovibrio sp. TH_2024_36128]|uniref:Uncharacterized protein n=1 Tax=Desulfovibrio falkowii TaxID=3136602 RepID=A0ABQ0E6Z7_9BACT